MIDIQTNGHDCEIVGDHKGLSGKIAVHSDGAKIFLPRSKGHVDIQIHGPDTLIDIANVRRIGRFRMISKNGGGVVMGKKSTLESGYFLADGANIILGEDCMVSFNVNFRTTDAHGIYDLKTGDRVNPVGDIVLDDHVWIGQGATISKNTRIGKSTIIGGFSFLGGAEYDSHSVYAGIPAKQLRDGVVWERRQAENIYEEGADIDPFFRDNMDAYISQ